MGATAAGVLVDAFKQLLSRFTAMEAELKALKESQDDCALSVNGHKFSSTREFKTYFDQEVLRVNLPGVPAADAELQKCFVDAGGLLY